MNENLNDAAYREEILKSIKPDSVKQHHELLKKIFHIEMKYREVDENLDYYENLYWCGFLLFLVGDLNDVKVLWEAKNINMDTSCGFDIQILVGAGINETIDHLERVDSQEVANYLKDCNQFGDFDELSKWIEFKKNYFYP